MKGFHDDSCFGKMFIVSGDDDINNFVWIRVTKDKKGYARLYEVLPNGAHKRRSFFDPFFGKLGLEVAALFENVKLPNHIEWFHLELRG